MSAWSKRPRWGRPSGPNEKLERDVHAEIAFHIEERVRDNERHGMSPEAAREEAERRFGDVSVVERELLVRAVRHRRVRGLHDVAADWLGDLHFAVRGMARRPGFTALAVLTIGLGTGGSTAVFSLADWLLFQPVPGVEQPDELVRVQFHRTRPGGFSGTTLISQLDYLDLGRSAPALTSLAASARVRVHIALPGDDDAPARRIDAAMVTDNFASTLGVRARIGRVLGPGDIRNPLVTVISERLWAEAFGRSPSAVGRTLLLNGVPFTVVGVTDDEFEGSSLLQKAQLWVPVEAHEVVARYGPAHLDDEEVLKERGSPLWHQLIGRLAAGATATEAQTQLRAAAENIAEAHPDDSSLELRLPMGAFASVPRVTAGIGLLSYGSMEDVTALLGLLGGVVVCVLLLACANVANLLLARATARRSEMAVRRAIGASRSQLVRQLLIEAAALALLGGAAGLAIAYFGLTLFEGHRLLDWLPPTEGIAVSGSLLGFTFGISLVAALLFGLAPAVAAVRNLGWVSRDAAGALVKTGRTLLTVQAAIAFVLVVGAGLLLDTLRALHQTDLGFEPEGVVEATVDPETQGYDEAEAGRYYRELLGRARATPGFEIAGLARYAVQEGSRSYSTVRPAGLPRDDPRALRVAHNAVSPGFFEALGLERIEGRDFRPDEMYLETSGEGLAVVSLAAARTMFPGMSAVGERIDLGGRTPRIVRIVGVVGDARLLSVKEPPDPWVYEPLGQRPVPVATLYVRGRAGEVPSARSVAALVEEIDPALPAYDVQPLTRRVDAGLTTERLVARVIGLFAALALLLAGVGIYGVTSTTVHGRTRELGVRVALGADRGAVRAMVLRDAIRIALLGVVLGGVAATQLVHLIAGRLWGVRPLDPLVYAVAAGTLVVAAAAAAWAPARKATRVDPVRALRV